MTETVPPTGVAPATGGPSPAPELPPIRACSLDAEMAVIGGILLRGDAIKVCLALPLVPEDFYKPAHEHLFKAMVTLTERGQPIDPVTLTDELRRTGREDTTGGLAYLSDLQACVPTAENIAHWATIVRDHAARRRIALLAAGVAEAALAGEETPLALRTRLLDAAEPRRATRRATPCAKGCGAAKHAGACAQGRGAGVPVSGRSSP